MILWVRGEEGEAYLRFICRVRHCVADMLLHNKN